MTALSYGNGLLMVVAESEKALQELRNENKRVLFRSDSEYTVFPEEYKLSLDDSAKCALDSLAEFDVVEFYNDSCFNVIYSSSSNDNALVVTNKCNSNCIMCPCSEVYRQKDNRENLDHLRQIVEYIPSDVRFLTITGGEPTLLKEETLRLMKAIRDHFEGTKFFLLTNGRSFSDKDFFEKFMESKPDNLRFAIPLYGYDASTHDSITQAKGSFEQTILGLKRLLRANCEIEIRIVISKLNYMNMDLLGQFIANELEGVSCVHIMATEMMGAAAKNHEKVWLDYDKAFLSSKTAIKTLMKKGIDVELYNFPLCKVEPGYWPLCVKSISDYKIRYGENCDQCSVKSLCGGVFRSSLLLSKMELRPITGEF